MFEHYLRPEQKKVIDCIACRMGVPTRRVRYFSKDHVVLIRPDRFNTRLLASKLATALKGASRGG